MPLVSYALRTASCTSAKESRSGLWDLGWTYFSISDIEVDFNTDFANVCVLILCKIRQNKTFYLYISFFNKNDPCVKYIIPF